jgi:hypothetical protein
VVLFIKRGESLFRGITHFRGFPEEVSDKISSNLRRGQQQREGYAMHRAERKRKAHMEEQVFSAHSIVNQKSDSDGDESTLAYNGCRCTCSKKAYFKMSQKIKKLSWCTVNEFCEKRHFIVTCVKRQKKNYKAQKHLFSAKLCE